MKTEYLGEAFLYVLKNDSPKIFSDFIKQDAWKFIKNFGASVKALLKLPYKLGIKIKKGGVKKSTTEAIEKTKEAATFIAKMPSRIKKAIKQLTHEIKKDIEQIETKKERSIYVGKLLTYFTSFLVGLVSGHTFPDKDIAWLGIGRHRNVFTHSALLLIAIHLFSQFLFRLIEHAESYLNEDADGIEVLRFAKLNLGAIALGIGVGVSAHLFIDGIFQPSGTVRGPGFNTILTGTTIDDQAFLLINSFFSTLLGGEVFEKNSIEKRHSLLP